MKKLYEELDLELIRFTAEDVLATSGGDDAAQDPHAGYTEYAAYYNDVWDTRYLRPTDDPHVYEDEQGNLWSVDPEMKYLYSH